MDPFTMVVAIVLIVTIARTATNVLAKRAGERTRQLELEVRAKELDGARVQNEMKLLEAKDAKGIPTWLDQSPEEVERWQQAAEEVAALGKKEGQ